MIRAVPLKQELACNQDLAALLDVKLANLHQVSVEYSLLSIRSAILNIRVRRGVKERNTYALAMKCESAPHSTTGSPRSARRASMITRKSASESVGLRVTLSRRIPRDGSTIVTFTGRNDGTGILSVRYLSSARK